MNTIARYYPWFEFAAKTLNKENEEADFEDFNDSKVFREIMSLIVKDKLSASEKNYIETEDETNEMYRRYWDGVREDAVIEGMEKGMEKGKAEGKAEAVATMAIAMYKQGITIEIICTTTNLSAEEVQKILHTLE